MAKRTICLSLVLLMILGLFPVTAAAEEEPIGLRPLSEGEAYSEMLVSQSMLDMIKDVEGFSATPYWDVSQWTIGYGSACGYNWNDKPDLVITREEADELLLTEVNEKYGTIVNDYCASIGRQPSQNQFDALVDFTYNLGGRWVKGCLLTEWLENPTTELALVDAMGRWGRVNSVPSYATCMRRIREAIVFLKGEYYLTYGSSSFETELTAVSNNNLPYYTVVIYDCDGGEIEGLSTEMSYHSIGEAFGSLPVPVREGYTFLGWQVTAVQTSSVDEPYMLEESMTAEKNLKVVALWEQGEWETEPEETEPEETEPEETEPEETEPEETEPEETEPEETEPEETEPKETEPEAPDAPVLTGTVTANSLTIRSGPGADYEALAYLAKGTSVEILARVTVGESVWGQIDGGWICLDYVELNLLTGTVTASLLTVRSGPGSEHEALGYLSGGEWVEIFAQETVGDMVWGRVAQGWISLDYVKLEDSGDTVPDVTEPTEPEETEPEETEPEETEPEETEPEETEPEETEPEVTEPEETGPVTPVITGTVRAASLTVRSGPGSGYDALEYLPKGTRVEITAQETVDGVTWGRITKGWICLDYVDADDGSADKPEREFLFEDVPSGAWYRENVEYVYQKGWMNGLTELRFGPNESMTRAMLVAVLYRMAGEPETSMERQGLFTDVSDSDYFCQAVAWAKEYGIVNGVSETEFAPNRRVTRQDAVTIFYRYFVGYLGLEDGSDSDLSGFADQNAVSAYAVPALEWAVEHGMISGSATDRGTVLDPASDLSRGQAAKLMSMLDRLVDDMV